MSKKAKGRNKTKRFVERCKIPPPPTNKDFLKGYTINNRADGRAIREYVELEAANEKVEHAEKVKTERLFDRIYDCWDVHTDKNRWWVITSPSNLYCQKHFPSLDYTLSFHIGLMARVAARDSRKPEDSQRKRLSPVWRRWEDAAEALDLCDESEEFQSIGMRCREAMIQLVRSLASENMVPENQELPKRSDVVGWSEHIANTIAGGSSAEYIRGYLKSTVKLAWQAANWLTHASGAGPHDAGFILEATQTVLAAFSRAVMRFESDSPDRCPSCGSYRISVGYNPDLNPPYVSACEKCDWSPTQDSAN
jgi:hypothetical protein